ncbi:MAG TPA: homocysteine S-methyltransferase family protein [Phycisphaerae bacterium]|nr:homocysteine S-methyltransferase family protein [Phycisphaerae bacterium]
MGLDLKEFTRQVRVLDGAWGTQLQARGLSGGACPELWNDQAPEAVEAVARGYVDAGSDVILTNTFGGNRFVLTGLGLADRAGELCEKGARISRRAAAGTDVKVFGSIGPTGKIVMMGEVPEADLLAAFREPAAALERGGVDALVLETFNELDELVLALRAARETTDLPIVCCMTFSSGPDRTNTMMGNSPIDLVAEAEGHGAAGVGANCGVGPENYVAVAELLRGATDLPIWIKANAGLPIVREGKTVFPMSPQEFGSRVPELVEAGANLVGGCCGTGPEFIREIRAALGR